MLLEEAGTRAGGPLPAAAPEEPAVSAARSIARATARSPPRPGAARAPAARSPGSACSSALMAVGVVAFVYQFDNGLVVTGMRNT